MMLYPCTKFHSNRTIHGRIISIEPFAICVPSAILDLTIRGFQPFCGIRRFTMCQCTKSSNERQRYWRFNRFSLHVCEGGGSSPEWSYANRIVQNLGRTYIGQPSLHNKKVWFRFQIHCFVAKWKMTGVKNWCKISHFLLSPPAL